MDPVTGHVFAWPILTDGLKEDHPEWFDDQEDDEVDDENLDEDEPDDRWGAS